MVTYKCKTCGGQLDISASGGFVCQYCGSKSFMSDADFKGNEEFRKKLLTYAKAKAIEKDNDYSQDSLWTALEHESFIMANLQPLTIDYIKKYPYPGCTCYVARENVVYVFESSRDASTFMSGLKSLTFPEADVKLSRCFPNLKMEISLKDDKKALVFNRKPGFYPADMFAPWPSEHLAWVISRMENLCCALEYSEIQFGGITPSSLYINPVTHEGALFGDWRNIKNKTDNTDLVSIRKTAIELAENTKKPGELYEFLNSEPAENAYDDFAKWDKVIEKGFGGHKFVKMN